MHLEVKGHPYGQRQGLRSLHINKLCYLNLLFQAQIVMILHYSGLQNLSLFVLSIPHIITLSFYKKYKSCLFVHDLVVTSTWGED